MTDNRTFSPRRARRRLRRSTRRLALISCAVLAGPIGASAAEAQAAPTVRGHELPAGPLAHISAVNDRGVLAGQTTEGAAAVWNPRNGRLRELGLLPGSTRTEAVDIDEHGRVVGAGTADFDGPYSTHPFRWTPEGGMVDLGTLGGTTSAATATNDTGRVVGFSNLADGTTYRAWRWTPSDGMEDLGVLPGDSHSDATGINADGRIVGRSMRVIPGPNGDRYVTRTFLWSPGRGLEGLPGLGGDRTELLAINDRNEAAGTATTADGTLHVVRWSRSTGTVDLGVIGADVAVRGLADSGAIIGSRAPSATSSDYRAFLYTPTCGFRDLPLPRSGDGSSFADAANNDGRVVGAVREGDINQPYRTFVFQLAHRPC